jgi:hypothetical protein
MLHRMTDQGPASPRVVGELTTYLEALLAQQGEVSWLLRAGTTAAARLTEEAEHVRALLQLHGAPIPGQVVVREPEADVLALVLATGRDLGASESRTLHGPIPGEQPPDQSQLSTDLPARLPTQNATVPQAVGLDAQSPVALRPRRPRLPWREETRRLLRSEGKAMHYTQIADHLASLGIQFGGRNPQATLLSYLSRDDCFSSLGRGYWYLAGEATAPSSDLTPTHRPRPAPKVRAISRRLGGVT